MKKTMIDQIATGKRIKQLCREMGVPPRDIMEEMGFTSTVPVYKWFSGKSLPSIDNLIILERLLDVRQEDILVMKNDNKSKEWVIA